MTEKVEFQGKISPEATGLPADLFDDPGKYDGDIPLWARTVRFLKQLDRTRPQNRDVPFNELAASIIKDPKIVRDLLNNLSLVSQIRPNIDVQDVEQELIGHLESAVSRRSNLPNWTPDKIEELIRLGIDSSGRAREMIKRMESALFNAPENYEEVIDIFYNAAWAMVATDDSEVREEILSIVCYETDILHATSFSTVLLMAGPVLSDDSHIRKFWAFTDALDAVGILQEAAAVGIDEPTPTTSIRARTRELKMLPVALDHYSLPLSEQLKSERLYTQRVKENPARVQELQERTLKSKKIKMTPDEVPFFGVGREEMADKIKIEQQERSESRDLPWPENLVDDPDEPLRVMLRETFAAQSMKIIWENMVAAYILEGFEKLTSQPIQISDHFELEVISRGLESVEQKNAVLRDIMQSFLTDKESQLAPGFSGRTFRDAVGTYSSIIGVYDDNGDVKIRVSTIVSAEKVGKLSSILELHRPIISLEVAKTIEEQNSKLRDDLSHQFTRSVGKRGYELLISDPALKTLGYESITFKQSGTNIKVNLVIDNQTFEFTLDSDYRIKPGDDTKHFQSLQDKAWLELLTLSHLKKLMCTEEDSLSDEMVGGKKQHEYYRKQKIGRIEHLRRLPLGQNFSTDQYIKCLKSDLPIKQLDRINKMRAEKGLGGTRETGIWTYISGVERDIDTGQAKPVKIAFATTTNDLRKVIPLGEISPEEIARIEKEILAEFK